MSRTKPQLKSKTLKLLELGAEETETRELIRRRWMQVLVHSCIYYRLNANIVPDKQWDIWARELVRLVKQHPGIAQSMRYPEHLLKFDGATGFDLPIENPYILKRAEAILRSSKNDKSIHKISRGSGKRKRPKAHRIHKSKHY